MSEVSEWAKNQMQVLKVLDLKLYKTSIAIQMFREALDADLKLELWKLAQVVAKIEWGSETELDDFSVEDKIVVRNKERELIL